VRLLRLLLVRLARRLMEVRLLAGRIAYRSACLEQELLRNASRNEAPARAQGRTEAVPGPPRWAWPGRSLHKTACRPELLFHTSYSICLPCHPTGATESSSAL